MLIKQKGKFKFYLLSKKYFAICIQSNGKMNILNFTKTKFSGGLRNLPTLRMLGVLIAILLVCVTYFFFIKPFKYWGERNVPQKSIPHVLNTIFNGLTQKIPIAHSNIELYNEFPRNRYVRN